MARLFRSIAIIVLTMIIVAPAYSKIVHITDYRKEVFDYDTNTTSKGNKCEGVGCIGYKNVSCDKTKNEYDTKQHNAVCEEFYKFEEKKCYKCYCPSKYEFTESQCTSTGFATPDDAYRCSLGDNNYYSTCNCADKYLLLNNFVNVTTLDKNFTYTRKDIKGIKGIAGGGSTKEGTEITCLDYTSFACKPNNTNRKVTNEGITKKTEGNGIITFSHKDDSKFITYRGNLNTIKYDVTYSTVCSTNVSFAEPLYDSTNTKKDTMTCAKTDTGTAYYYPQSSYYYFTGDCWEHKDKSNCIGTQIVDCAAIESHDVSVYNSTNDTKGSQSCKKVTGCSTGRPANTDYICIGGYPEERKGMSITKISAGDYNCGKLTGCDTSDGYTAFGSMSSTAYASAMSGRSFGETAVSSSNLTASGTIYDSRIKTTKVPPAIKESEWVDYLICRKPIGCATGYMDTESCWSGCAAWFVK
ncbi:MAG: hypothetical protein E7017_06595 [Alphaproteobacteria bacterium]|nr:hypothetical protein [Alphaproteobacteria bacterium]